MQALDIYRVQARYNRWFNGRLYDVASELDDEQRRRDLGAFFGSVHATLGHILLCDYSWLYRCDPVFEQHFPPGTDGPTILSEGLGRQLFEDFDEMRRHRAALDEATEDWIAGLGQADLDAEIEYRTAAGEEHRHVRWWALTHAFNHQTHHRGQVTTLLSQLGRDVGVTDLMVLLRYGPKV